MTETHLAVAKSLAAIPQKNGNPIPGKFPYKAEHDPYVTTYTYTISLDANGYVVGDTLYIAAHAAVVLLDESGNIIQGETSWGQGDPFPGKNWAMYFTYTIQPCTPQPGNGTFRTQTQGGWGTGCAGNNPGCYRDAHFAETFPTGMVIGSKYTIKFTSAGAVEAFLPTGGKATPLKNDYVNPTTTEAGVFAGQVAALTLSVNFDLADPFFGRGSEKLWLRDLIYQDPNGSPCNGMTVWQILQEANLVLGGQPSPSGLKISTLNDVVSRINENFVDGTMDGGYLKLPE